MGDVDQGLSYALAFIGLALPFLSRYIDIGEFIRSYRHAEHLFWATTTKLHLAKISFNKRNRGFSAARPPTGTSAERSIALMVGSLNEMCAEIERELATICRDNTDTQVLDPEAQLPPRPRFASPIVKLKWSLRDRQRVLENKVDVFSGQVDILDRHSTTNQTLLSPVLTCSISTPDQSTIWLTDFRGTVRRFNIELCKSVGNFVLCLFLALKSSTEPLDQPTLAALLNGEFWVVAEDQHDISTALVESSSNCSRCVVPHGHGVDKRHGAILADTWEANVRPGRRFKMIMPKGDTTSHNPTAQLDNSVGPSLDKKTLHEPWEAVVRPILPNILQLLGLEERALSDNCEGIQRL